MADQSSKMAATIIGSNVLLMLRRNRRAVYCRTDIGDYHNFLICFPMDDRYVLVKSKVIISLFQRVRLSLSIFSFITEYLHLPMSSLQ